jgi:cell shape-determining protein MreD
MNQTHSRRKPYQSGKQQQQGLSHSRFEGLFFGTVLDVISISHNGAHIFCFNLFP